MNIRQTAIRTLLFGLLLVIAISIFYAVYIVTGPVIPQSHLQQLKQGMSKSEVRAILGSPQIIQSNQEWVYSRWGNPGWVEVHFDVDEHFDSYNDESP